MMVSPGIVGDLLVIEAGLLELISEFLCLGKFLTAYLEFHDFWIIEI